MELEAAGCTEPLDAALKYAMMLVGIREINLPTPLETKVLTDFISDNYGQHSPAEIVLAFRMALAGKLGLSDEQCNPFGDFSTRYFACIMNAYRRWAGHSMKYLENTRTVHQQMPEAPAPTPAELLQINLFYAWAKQKAEWKKPYDQKFLLSFFKLSRHETNTTGDKKTEAEDSQTNGRSD